jgi:predicted outer membrane protein
MKKILSEALLAAGFILATTVGLAQDAVAGGSPVNARDTEAVQSICNDSLLVQREAEMANQRSQNTRVKQVVQLLARDYGKTKLQFLSTSQALGAPIAPELTPRAARAIARLESVPGMAFDKAALIDLVTNEQVVLRKLQDESSQGNNTVLKEMAASSIPRLQDDIYQVVILQSDLNVAASAAIGMTRRDLASKP